MCSKLKVKIDSRDIDRAFRIGQFSHGGHRTIIVEFTSQKAAKKVINMKWEIFDLDDTHDLYGIFINEDLTPIRTALLSAAKDRFLHRAWTTEGDIWVRPTPNAKPQRIRDKDHLSEVKLTQPLPPDVFTGQRGRGRRPRRFPNRGGNRGTKQTRGRGRGMTQQGNEIEMGNEDDEDST